MSEKNKEEIKTTSQPMSAVRMDELGVDDVAIDATMFRFERMDEQTFWLCAYRGEKRTTFTMWTQGGKLYCRRDDDELGTTDDSENPVTAKDAEIEQAHSALSVCDDIRLDVSLADSIADLQAAREAAEHERDNYKEALQFFVDQWFDKGTPRLRLTANCVEAYKRAKAALLKAGKETKL